MNNENDIANDPNAPLTEQDTTVGDVHDLSDSVTSDEFLAEHDRLQVAERELTRNYENQVAQSLRDLRQSDVATNVLRNLSPMMPDLTCVRSRDIGSENLRFVFENEHATFTLNFAGDDIYLDVAVPSKQVRAHSFQIASDCIPTDILLAIMAYVFLLPTMPPLPKRARAELINERASAGEALADIMAVFFGGSRHAGHKHGGDELNFNHLKNVRVK